MAKSFVDFKEYGFWSHDSFLEVWVFYFVNEIERLDSVPPWLQELKKQWLSMATAGMLGTVELSLNDYITDEKGKFTLLELAKKTNHFFVAKVIYCLWNLRTNRMILKMVFLSLHKQHGFKSRYVFYQTVKGETYLQSFWPF